MRCLLRLWWGKCDLPFQEVKLEDDDSKKKKKKSLHGVGAAVEGTFLMTLFVTTRYSAHTFAFQHIPVLLRE